MAMTANAEGESKNTRTTCLLVVTVSRKEFWEYDITSKFRRCKRRSGDTYGFRTQTR